MIKEGERRSEGRRGKSGKPGWHTTSGSRDERATKPDNVWVSWIRLGWTSRTMGNFCEDQAKILVEEYVQRYRRVHGKIYRGVLSSIAIDHSTLSFSYCPVLDCFHISLWRSSLICRQHSKLSCRHWSVLDRLLNCSIKRSELLNCSVLDCNNFSVYWLSCVLWNIFVYCSCP